ncbi:MAG: hypothetical protein IJX82_00920, partial [Clostridia bacterium]|nr:hypothetical protein [Clostridia bacterium]
SEQINRIYRKRSNSLYARHPCVEWGEILTVASCVTVGAIHESPALRCIAKRVLHVPTCVEYSPRH